MSVAVPRKALKSLMVIAMRGAWYSPVEADEVQRLIRRFASRIGDHLLEELAHELAQEIDRKTRYRNDDERHSGWIELQEWLESRLDKFRSE
jgi:hypothetical protein